MPQADVTRVRRVFELELERGCQNQVVIGGLDRMLIQMKEDGLLTDSPLASRVAALPATGYRSLEEDARRDWVRTTIHALTPSPAAKLSAPVSSAPPGRIPPSRPAGAAGRMAPATRRTRPAASRVQDEGDAPSIAAPPTQSPAALRPDSPASHLPGIGKSAAEKFEKLGVVTASDAVFLFPRRFNDFSDLRKIADLQPAKAPQTIVATVFAVSEIRWGRRVKGTQAVLTDATGSLRVVWFNMGYIARALSEGMQVVVSGRVKDFRGRLQMENPEFEPLDDELDHTGRLIPVYPATAGLGQRTIRRAVKAAVEQLATRVADPVPAWLREETKLPPVAQAIATYHYPPTFVAAENARQRLAVGEFLAIQVAVLMRRAEWQQGEKSQFVDLGENHRPFFDSLPFQLTPAQERCLEEIFGDLRRTHPMLRLLQGDVGSGKTVVAFGGMLAAVASGYQAALMAPTEILAEQHYRSFARLLGGEATGALSGVFVPQWLGRPIRVLLLTGSLTASQKLQIRSDTAHGGADIIIGTHALLEAEVLIPRLALAVVDEQHRFGVMQRAKLRQKGLNPHLLVMTATPIPRTLALTVYGDLEVSTIDEMPPGRLPVKTRWYQPHERDAAYDFIRKRLDAGEQAFVICPLVEESETLDVRSAEEEFDHLSNGPLRGYTLDLLHGRMNARQKEEIMARFGRGESQALVSTSVIEVGIDVPNATVIVIEGSERFGLSQLHQFRGRVGRSSQQSFCLLFSSEEDPGPEATERLEAMVDTTDGFKLAEVDLKMRGEGEAWGKLQSGVNTMLRVARLTDRELLLQARAMAAQVLARDPYLQKPEHYALAATVKPFLEKAAEAN
ncbi:MAG: ATP-dependent DNA helicase RecG [Tepidiformaceae bacterium]